MTPAELAADLRTRINPAYATQLGTESYERRLCAEAIEGPIAENNKLRAALAERDAEIERMAQASAIMHRWKTEDDEMIAAQRKVLNQALEALSYLKVEIIDGWDARKQQHLRDKAITAIQEVLS